MIDRLRAIAAARTAPGTWEAWERGNGRRVLHGPFETLDGMKLADAAFIVTADRTYEALLAVAMWAQQVLDLDKRLNNPDEDWPDDTEELEDQMADAMLVLRNALAALDFDACDRPDCHTPKAHAAHALDAVEEPR